MRPLPGSTARTAAFSLCIAGAVAMVAGSFGPWATWLGGFGSASGIDRGDGRYSAAAGVLAIALLMGASRSVRYARWSALGAATLGIAGIVVFLVNRGNYEELRSTNLVVGVLSDLDLLHPGWGIYAVGVGSAIVTVGSLMLAASRGTER